MSTDPGCRTRVESFEKFNLCTYMYFMYLRSRGRSFFTVFKYLVQTFPQFETSNILVFVA